MLGFCLATKLDGRFGMVAVDLKYAKPASDAELIVVYRCS